MILRDEDGNIINQFYFPSVILLTELENYLDRLDFWIDEIFKKIDDKLGLDLKFHPDSDVKEGE
jgi:hypothetical protein